jgi:hypothetical protein
VSFCKNKKLPELIGIIAGIIVGIIAGILVAKILGIPFGIQLGIVGGIIAGTLVVMKIKENEAIKEIEGNSIKDLLEILKEPNIERVKAYTVWEKLCKEEKDEIYKELKEFKIEDLLCIKGTITSRKKLNTEVENTSFKLFSTFAIFMLTDVFISIYSKTAIIEKSFNFSFFGYKTVLVDYSVVSVILGYCLLVYLIIVLIWGNSIFTNKLKSMEIILIDMIDYFIELEKEKKKNKEKEKNKEKISEINRSRFSEEKLCIEIIEKRDRRVRRQVKGGRKLKKHQ